MEYTEPQRLFLVTICRFFHETGEWPTYGHLDHELEDNLDVEVVGEELAAFMFDAPFAPSTGFDPKREASLGIAALYRCAVDGIYPDVAEDLDAFMQVIQIFIEKYRAGDENTRITSAEVRSRLGLTSLMLQKVYLLVALTPLVGGSGFTPAPNQDWESVTSENPPDLTLEWFFTVSPQVRNYRKVSTIEGYLNARAELQARAQAKYTPPPLPSVYNLPPYSYLHFQVSPPSNAPESVEEGGIIIPMSLVDQTRDYIKETTRQINTTYDVQCYDACLVMCRRLIETLIIEMFEAHGDAGAIQDPGTQDFYQLGMLVDKMDQAKGWNLGRNTKKVLKKFKELGDRSAHSRRYHATRQEIDDIKSDLRLVVQELVSLMKYPGPSIP